MLNTPTLYYVFCCTANVYSFGMTNGASPCQARVVQLKDENFHNLF